MDIDALKNDLNIQGLKYLEGFINGKIRNEIKFQS